MVSHLNENELYQAYLTSVYQNTKGYQLYTDSQHLQFRKDRIDITYGELLFPSVDKLINRAKLKLNDIFLDLGSGLGKCALQIFIKSDVSKIVAIEAATALHQQAMDIYHKVKKDCPFFWDDGRETALICDNFLKCDWQDATVIYTCSTCFTPELLFLIGEKINQHSKIEQVFSLRPLPTIKLPLKQVFGVECSWDSALCFHYAKP
jgi:hypothetical protein